MEELRNKEPLLKQDQRRVHQNVLDDNNIGGIFFLDAPGDSGKCFVTNFLLSALRKVAIAVEVIATDLLRGRHTAHSSFNMHWIELQ